MSSAEAKRILAAYRRGDPDAHDPAVVEALGLAQRDPELRQWLERQTHFHRSVRQNLHRIPIPEYLREQILDRAKIVEPLTRIIEPIHTNSRRKWLAAAAALILLLGLAAVWFRTSSEQTFQIFRERMVRAVLRQYSMDVETNDMAQIRQFLRVQKAPSDYTLPPGLAQLPVTGAGVLSWHRDRVSMLCLDGGARQGILFLFVVDRAAVKRPPGGSPELAQVSKLLTASWTAGDRTYVLASHGDRESLQKHLQ
jgi:hypothetical protein